MLLAKLKLTAVVLMLLVTFATTLAQTGTRPALPGQDRPGRTRGVFPSSPTAFAPSKTPEPGRTLNLEVVSGADHVPLPGAAVWIQVNWTQPRVSQGQADNEGHYAIELPGGGFSWLRIGVVHPGFAPLELLWSGEEPIPDSYTVSLEAGCRSAAACTTSKGGRSLERRGSLQVWARPLHRGAGASDTQARRPRSPSR